ncbi:MAG: hypothetical protein ACKVRP_14660 [Bacteroidota bacterium]
MELGPGFGGGSERPRFDDSVVQLIRAAEKSIALQKFSYAKEQLSLAQTLDPKNEYITAILDRVNSMQKPTPSALSADPQRYLSVSVGPEFASGIKNDEVSSKDIQGRVRQLTNVAATFLEQGSYENAFDALMKAYLLDPVSPYVITCEKAVLPVWQRQHRPMSASPSLASTLLRSERKTTMAPPEFTSTPRLQGSLAGSDSSQNDHERLEALKLQKEMERQERDRAVWRQASNPPKLFGQTQAPPKNASQENNLEQPKQERGLFAKLKLGKFLSP